MRFRLIAFIIVFSSSFSDAPQVSLRLGRTLDADNIRTGHDVYFECDVKANPPALRLEWLHNVSIQWYSVVRSSMQRIIFSNFK